MAYQRNQPLLRLDRFLSWIVPVLLVFALAYVAMGIVYRDIPSLLTASIIALVDVALLVARQYAGRSKTRSAVVLVASSFLTAIIIMTALQPQLAPSHTIVPLVVALVVFLYSPAPRVWAILIGSGFVTLLVVAAGLFSPVTSALPPLLIEALRVGATVCNLISAAVLIQQLRQQLMDALHEAHAAHVALAEAHARLFEQAQRDALTGLLQRGYLHEVCADAFGYARATHTSVGVVMLDLDHFKQVNDTFGHAAGDMVLVQFADLLRSMLRSSDWACRYGGEEFVLIIPSIELEALVQRVEQLRSRMETLQLEFQGHCIGALTLSAGVAIFPQHGTSVEQILQLADEALYQAKQGGRNCVSVAALPEVAEPSLF
jgi:diguanylate cyclase (GGDEF)-like protein